MGDTAFFGGGAVPPAPLPAGVERPETVRALTEKRWEVLALSIAGCRMLKNAPEAVCACGTILLPSGWSSLATRQVRAERVVSCGLSSRDSLTFSSIGDGDVVVCVQRALIRPDGGQVEPQELPLDCIGDQTEDLLVVIGLGLLL
jgi:hypothetical protein